MPRLRLALLGLALGVANLGCGTDAKSDFSFVGSRLPASPGGQVASTPRMQAEASFQAPVRPNSASQALTPPPNADVIERKIIYSGHLTVVVKDLDAAVAKTEQILDEFKGYIAKSEIIGNAGSRRQATFTLRVPAESFRQIKAAFVALGIAEKNSSDSKDVTEEFVDITARVKNLKAEEETLNKLLKETHRFEEMLKLREEITRLRGNIETAEGRLKYLSALASLSTLDLTLWEVLGAYKPPEPDSPIDPTFSERISTAFSASVRYLRQFGEGIAVFFVTIGPWLPVIVIVGYAVYRFLRWCCRVNLTPPRSRRETVTAAEEWDAIPLRNPAEARGETDSTDSPKPTDSRE